MYVCESGCVCASWHEAGYDSVCGARGSPKQPASDGRAAPPPPAAPSASGEALDDLNSFESGLNDSGLTDSTLEGVETTRRCTDCGSGTRAVGTPCIELSEEKFLGTNPIALHEVKPHRLVRIRLRFPRASRAVEVRAKRSFLVHRMYSFISPPKTTCQK